MGRRKGREVKEASENLIPMNQRTPEERKRISRMGVEARRKKKEQNMENLKILAISVKE